MELLNVYPFSLMWKILLLVLYGAGMYTVINNAIKDFANKGLKGIIDEVIMVLIMTGLIIYLLATPPTIVFELITTIINEGLKAISEFIKFALKG